MTTAMPPSLTARDWDRIKLVVFDVDGTLYDQRRLRVRMALDLMRHTLMARDLRPLLVLRAYRRIRERLAEQEVGSFETRLLAETVDTTRYSPHDVTEIVREWIERKPNAHLAACRYPGLPELFDGIKRSGRSIGILSDYPVHDKLDALGLTADHITSAVDPDVDVMKPHPRGLQTVIGKARATAETTVLLGDRVERDGIAAQRLGVRALIRSPKPITGWQTYASYNDALFAPFLTP